jgi:hypothetical protein
MAIMTQLLETAFIPTQYAINSSGGENKKKCQHL